MKKLLSIILAILMIVTMLPMAVLPAGAALTPTAKGGCNGDHSGYTLLKNNLEITEPGNYYINTNWYSTTYGSTLVIECSGTVTVCLNGHDLYHTGYGSRVVYLSPNGGELTVNLCDCKGTGEIYHEKGDSGIDFTPGVITLNMYGGTIRDCNSGISTWRNSTVNMYGGTIKNCSYYGIFQNDLSCKVNIYGGSIINNTEGIRVCSADSVTLTGSPVISGNTNGDLYYRIPNSVVIAKDLSVSSPITIGQDSSASGDYAVVKVDSADMLGSFKYINNTKKLFYNNNQIFVHGDSHSFKDATCAAPKTCTICGATEGVADNTAHIWGEGALTRPTKTEEGYYTYTCSACGDTKTEVTERAANYAKYTKALNDLRAYLDSDKLTDDVKASVAEWLEIYDSDEAYKFIAGEEETVNLYIEAALQYAAEIEAAIQDCLAGNHSGSGEYCDICGAILHTCDFTGEWNYSSEKHWKQCDCGEISEEAEHSFTDGKCGCGFECAHEILSQDRIRPVQNADGTWSKGTVKVICSICDCVTSEKEFERDHEGYAAFEEAVAKLEVLLQNDELVKANRDGYAKTLNNLKNVVNSTIYMEDETAMSYITADINRYISEIEAGLADGTMRKADYSTLKALLDEVRTLVDNDISKIISSMVGLYYNPNGYYTAVTNSTVEQSAASQKYYIETYTASLETLIAAIKDGSGLKADYTAIDEAIAEIEQKLADENVTDEAKAGLEEIKAQLEEMKKNPLTSKVDVEELMDAVEELDEAIVDGTVVIAEGSVILEAYDAECGRIMSEKYGEEAVNRIVSIMMQNKNEELVELYAYADTITGTIAENADKIEELKRKMDALYAAIERCIIGTHTVEEYAITSSAKCGVNAVETGICYYCVESVTREVENSALTHSFTKYEETEAPKCGVEGKEIALCDNGCGETHEREIEALTHSFGEYIYNDDATCTADGTKTTECIYGCGETDTVTAEGTMLEHADEDGNKICDDCETELEEVCPDCGGPAHEETGVSQYICILVTLIKLVVSLIKTLSSVA